MYTSTNNTHPCTFMYPMRLNVVVYWQKVLLTPGCPAASHGLDLYPPGIIAVVARYTNCHVIQDEHMHGIPLCCRSGAYEKNCSPSLANLPCSVLHRSHCLALAICSLLTTALRLRGCSQDSAGDIPSGASFNCTPLFESLT